VFAKNHGKGETWIYGEIIGSTGPLSFEVKLEDRKKYVTIKIISGSDTVRVYTSTRKIQLFLS